MGRTLPFLPTCGSSSKTLSFHTTTEFEDMFTTEDMDTSVESVIHGLSYDRLFFNPGKTSSTLEEAKPKEKKQEKQEEKEKEKEKQGVLPFKKSVSMMGWSPLTLLLTLKVNARDVEADEGLKELDNLQELLSLYLAFNDKTNHGYIIGAFVDLLVNLGPPSKDLKPSLCSSSSSSINGHEQSLLMECGGSSNSNNNNGNEQSLKV